MPDFCIKQTTSNIEQLLYENHPVQFHPTGYSMYPMFVPGRDEAIVIPISKKRLKRGDVVLYRRDESILVLHRICRITKKGIYLVGDNQTILEGPLRPDQMKGVLSAFVRNGRTISVRNPLYFISARIWLTLRPVRRPFQLIVKYLKQLKHGS